MGKERFRSVAIRQCLNKTMPLIHPVVAVALTTFFVSMHTRDREVTRLMPIQRTSQGLPEVRIKKRFFRRHDKGRIIILARPRGIIVRGSFVVGLHPVRTAYVVASLDGCVYRFLDRHRLCSL